MKSIKRLFMKISHYFFSKIGNFFSKIGNFFSKRGKFFSKIGNFFSKVGEFCENLFRAQTDNTINQPIMHDGNRQNENIEPNMVPDDNRNNISQYTPSFPSNSSDDISNVLNVDILVPQEIQNNITFDKDGIIQAGQYTPSFPSNSSDDIYTANKESSTANKESSTANKESNINDKKEVIKSSPIASRITLHDQKDILVPQEIHYLENLRIKLQNHIPSPAKTMKIKNHIPSPAKTMKIKNRIPSPAQILKRSHKKFARLNTYKALADMRKFRVGDEHSL